MFKLGGQLLRTLEKHRLLRDDENIKGIGWFLVCIGESLEKGSLVQSRNLRKQYEAGQMPAVNSLAIAFCTTGDEIMNWAAGIYNRERKKK